MAVVHHILAAPDKFRGSASASEVAVAIAAAAAAVGVSCTQLPMADGGEGLLAAFGGANREDKVTGPLGAPVSAGWRLDAGGRAVIESALASGLTIAGGAAANDPVAATSRGTGELIALAIDAGASRILVGVGGSATTDGGMGAVEVLAALAPISRAGREVLVCCDVTTTYLDAARVFGSQKGADAEQIKTLSSRLARQVAELRERFGLDVVDLPGGGSAGGLAGGLAAVGGRLVSGFEQVATEHDLAEAIAAADLVVTGEGMIDRQSFRGKVVGGIADLAAAAGVPVLAIAGDVSGAIPSSVTAISMSQRFGMAESLHDPLACIRTIVTEQLTK
jgi:glycerate kinase